MITFKAQGKSGRKLVGLGISKTNYRLLRQGSPIKMDLEPFGVDNTTVWVFYGSTDREIARHLREKGFLQTEEEATQAARPWWARLLGRWVRPKRLRAAHEI